MAETSATVIYEDRPTQTVNAWAEGEELWLKLSDLTQTTGWELKPEGVCRDELCVPVPAGRSEAFLYQHENETWFNLSEFARLMEQPSARDDKHSVWSFGSKAEEREQSLISSTAPDFTLPDLSGKHYSLSDFRGTKVVLALWASW
jgi:hypothetical protein